MDKFRALEFFILVSERGSYAEAAKDLGVSPSSISKAVTRLEESLGFKLFKRSTRDLKLTDEGAAYLEVARGLMAGLSDSEKLLKSSNDSIDGLIRINTPFDYGHMYIQPFITEFKRHYPQVNFEISFEDCFVNFVANSADIVIRTGTLADCNLNARKLSPMDFVLCASPDYLSKCSFDFSPDNLGCHTWIRFRTKSQGKLVPVMVDASGTGFGPIEPGKQIVVDNGLAMARLCADGAGLAQMPHFLARPWLLSGELLPLLPPFCPSTHGVYLLYDDRKYLAGRCRVFIDELVKFVEARNESPSRTWLRELKVLQA